MSERGKEQVVFPFVKRHIMVPTPRTPQAPASETKFP